MIQQTNFIETQFKNECSAYSSAFLLRHLGLTVNGAGLYPLMPCKLPDGTVSPKGILRIFKKHHINIRFCKGDTDTLKSHLSMGNPAILFIRVFENKSFLHYVPVIGYDKDYFYLADSLEFMRNCPASIHYNRCITAEDLNKLWDTPFPFWKNCYFVIQPGK